MDFKTSIRIAFSGLKSKKTRTFLTMLGIIIGVASVIIIISVGAGAQSLILNQVRGFGTDLIAIFPGASEEKGPPPSVFGTVNTSLKNEDIDALLDERNAPHVLAVTYYVQGTGTMAWRNNQLDGTFVATTASYVDVHERRVAIGRFFNEDEEKNMARVAVLGHNVKKELFEELDPLGQTIKIKKQQFKVIGIMPELGVQGFQNQDNLVLIPITTGQKLLLGIDHVSLARVKIDSNENVDRAIEDIGAILRDRHNLRAGEFDDFSIRAQTQSMEIFSSITNSLTYFLAAIAAISLLVGGIGIMNIMLINITERTREIGLCKAIGAKNKNILNQFLFETIALTLSGGILGVFVGVFFSWLVSFVARYMGFDWDFIISILAIGLSCSIAILVGLVFGIYPAYKASKLNPIEALQYE
ncbi:MAG TPA: FtsX-like permease family protein [Candidatus Uhrbacteria bacterium]|nr:FtsX-like permease family protein [Candidatus Uhrbacteria bacterium]